MGLKIRTGIFSPDESTSQIQTPVSSPQISQFHTIEKFRLTDLFGTDRFVLSWQICVELTHFRRWKWPLFETDILNWRVNGTEVYPLTRILKHFKIISPIFDLFFLSKIFKNTHSYCFVKNRGPEKSQIPYFEVPNKSY